jgi:hypothetical protein
MFGHEYVGNLHVHSIDSDGAATLDEIVAAAGNAGLDFVCLNDHAHMCGDLRLEREGFYGKVLFLAGAEIGIRGNHYLAFDLKQPVAENDSCPQQVIGEVNDQGGFGFLAHPFELGMPFIEKSVAYRWDDLTVKGFTGICIWNFTSRWKERIRTVFHGLFCLWFKTQSLQGPSPETLQFWDGLCKERKCVAIGGSDAHGSSVQFGPWRLTPLTYDFLLKTVNIHILLPRSLSKDLGSAKEQVYGAMKAGRLFLAHDGLASSRGFRMDYLSRDGVQHYQGEEAVFGGGGTLVVELPEYGEIRLIRDGKKIRSWRGEEAIYPVVENGVYRVEVYRRTFLFGWRPWIYSNPIYLR